MGLGTIVIAVRCFGCGLVLSADMRMFKQTSKTWIKLFAAIVILSSCVSGQTGTPIPVTPEPFEAHVILAYGRGWTSTDPNFSPDPFMFLALPELVVYDNGLTLFSCRGEIWPEICESQMTLETVAMLTDKLDALGVFERGYYPDSRLGPRTYFSLEAKKNQASGKASTSWTSASIDRSRELTANAQRLSSVLAILDRVPKDLLSGKLLYQPEFVALRIHSGVKCPTDRSSSCTTSWPFNFSSKLMITGRDCPSVEVPLSMSDIKAAIPEVGTRPLIERYFFQDGNDTVFIEIRPYLPGEKMSISCGTDRWNDFSPDYSTLPFP